MNGKIEKKTICQWWKISKYPTVINHVVLRGPLITQCITFLMYVNVVMGKQDSSNTPEESHGNSSRIL